MFLNIGGEVLIVFVTIIDVHNISRPLIYRYVQRGDVDIKLK